MPNSKPPHAVNRTASTYLPGAANAQRADGQPGKTASQDLPSQSKPAEQHSEPPRAKPATERGSPQAARTESVRPPTVDAVHRVYLSEEWYLNVDEHGYLVGLCAEGALGYVLQLQSADQVDTDKEYLALKVPRLRADTLEENAHIVRTLEDEARAVRNANRGDQSRLKTSREDQQAVEGLVPTAVLKRPNFLRGPRMLSDTGSDSQSLPQNQCIPFLSFGKDHRLRICNVRYDFSAPGKPKLLIFPNTPSMIEALSWLTPKLWNKYFAGDHRPGLTETVYFETAPVTEQTVAAGESATASSHEDDSGELAAMGPAQYRPHGQLARALTTQKTVVTWYAGVPSIVFKWSQGTLQRAISTGAHKDWELEKHYTLARQILRGLRTLHRAGIIHADVRPANIMALGSLSNPEHFHLSDYGSFANDQAGGGSGSGHTTAPGVVRHRASVFYSRERRAGIEREDADVAIIIGNTGAARDFQPGYFVRLGWKADLVTESGEVRPDVITDMLQCWRALDQERRKTDGTRSAEGRSQLGDGTAWNLASGDLFRVRDYVFRIREIPLRAHAISTPTVETTDAAALVKPGGCIDFLCDPTYTYVLLEKLSVRSGHDLFDDVRIKEALPSNGAPDSLPAAILLDLPRWIEIRQSSVASDLYSVGVTLLYSVYITAMYRKRLINSKPGDDGGASQDTPVDIEERVTAMLRRLEDEVNFNQLWSELDHVCYWIELAIEQPIPIMQLIIQDTAPQDAISSSRLEFGQIARNLLQTIVGLSSELDDIALFGCRNYGHFLLFIHFVLSCIHRRSHKIPGKMHGRVRLEFPFCEDRFEKGTKDQVANAALARLDKLSGFFRHPTAFSALHKFLEGTDFTAARQSDYQLRQQVYDLSEENKRLRDEGNKAQQAQKALQECLRSASERRDEFVALQAKSDAVLGEERRLRLESENTLMGRLTAALDLLRAVESSGRQNVTFGRRLDSTMLDRIQSEIKLLNSLICETVTVRHPTK